MKTKILITISALFFLLSVFGQKPVMELTFTAVNNSSYVQLDSIKVINRTQGGDTVLYYPDTVLVLEYQVGITELSQEKTVLQVFQNYPNPVKDQTTITLYVPEKDKVALMITDILGIRIISTERLLDKGFHTFRFVPGSGQLYFFNAQWKGHNSSVKILHSASHSPQTSSLEYISSDPGVPQLKTTETVQEFSFTLGDELLYIGYSDTLQSGILDSPATSEPYTFQFATNIPCPGTPTVDYEGQVYNTIQILSQCWLKENLNVGIMINGNQSQANNSIKEKYCVDNNPDSCTKYGGLYQWNEMMQYATQQGVQGICPPGWSLPTDEDWKVLEGAVDSQYGIVDPEWDINLDWRGYDAGTNMKTNNSWYGNGNGTDLFGFSALPGGYRGYNSYFYDVGYQGYWWTSSEISSNSAWSRILKFDQAEVYRINGYAKGRGFSVRCLRDY